MCWNLQILLKKALVFVWHHTWRTSVSLSSSPTAFCAAWPGAWGRVKLTDGWGAEMGIETELESWMVCFLCHVRLSLGPRFSCQNSSVKILRTVLVASQWGWNWPCCCQSGIPFAQKKPWIPMCLSASLPLPTPPRFSPQCEEVSAPFPDM